MQQEIPPADDKNTAWDQKLDLSGENFGFGPTSQSSLPPTTVPQQKSGSRRTCLLAIVGLLTVCVLICICGGLLLYQTRELVLVNFYHQILQDQTLNAVEINLICAGSQAETFHRAFLQRYPHRPVIKIETSEIDDDTNQVQIEGTIEYEGQTSDYLAIYTIDTEGDFLYVFGCISEIEQVLPPLIPYFG